MDWVILALFLLLDITLAAIPLGLLVCLLACLFSSRMRRRVRSRRWGYAIWAMASVLIVVWILMPHVGSTRRAEKAQAMAEVQSLSATAKVFYQEYGRFPLQTVTNDHIYADDQSALIAILRARPGTTNDNPRRIVFLEVPDSSISPSGEFRDPWDQPYHIIADWSGDGVVMVGTNRVARRVAVWSNGPDGKNDFGAGDDVKTW